MERRERAKINKLNKTDKIVKIGVGAEKRRDGFPSKRLSLFTAAVLAVAALFAVFLAACSNGSAQRDKYDLPAGDFYTSYEIGGSADLLDVPEYSGSPFIVINENEPLFTESEKTDVSFEYYSPLDSLGRCGAAAACIGVDIMPTEERGSIGSVKPSGWQTVKYDIVDGKYLYNRCHLIAYMLSGENANEKNLITGTRYLNVEGMLPFENMVADYVKETKNHVMYRVTPVFDGANLVANGLLMEALSVEDGGDGISFCVFVYNVQPGVVIDYSDGASSLAADSHYASDGKTTESAAEKYVINKNTRRFHKPSCPSIAHIKEENKLDYSGARSELIKQGYEPCESCKP